MVKPQPLTFTKRCDHCLFRSRKIVEDERKQEIIENCIANQSAFVCHKTHDLVCKGFDDTFPLASQTQRIGKRLGLWKTIDEAEYMKTKKEGK